MNLNETFTKNGVTFKRYGHKWIFTVGTSTLIQGCRGGKPVAEKIAGIVAGGNKRTKGNGLDNLARANITQLIGK